MGDIKLFVCCHKRDWVPDHPLLLPIQVGAALSSDRFEGFIHDDGGENISHKNRSYCELTAQYWAWKNARADYCGFFHYRRYLYPNLNEKLPYTIRKEPTSSLLKKLGYCDFEKVIRNYDAIVPTGENMHVSVAQHYASAPFHHIHDLETVKQIIGDMHPDYVLPMQSYLVGTICYFGNIYIMKREVFEHYCTWLFSILEEFDHRSNTANYSAQEKRVDGYLAERLLGVYIVHLRQEKTATILELPRVHFQSGPDGLCRRAVNGLFPPGSRRRAHLKMKFQQLERRYKYGNNTIRNGTASNE